MKLVDIHCGSFPQKFSSLNKFEKKITFSVIQLSKEEQINWILFYDNWSFSNRYKVVIDEEKKAHALVRLK